MKKQKQIGWSGNIEEAFDKKLMLRKSIEQLVKEKLKKIFGFKSGRTTLKRRKMAR